MTTIDNSNVSSSKVSSSKVAQALASLFFLCIAMPLISSVITPDVERSDAEKRSLQPWPQWSDRESIKGYFGQVTDYANDHFGFREPLIRTHKNIMWALNESPSDAVVRGTDDWLFLKIKDPLLSKHKFSNTSINNILKRRADYIKKMNDELISRGIVYHYVVAANKMSVYSEHLPAIYNLTNVDATLDLFKSLLDPQLSSAITYTDQVVDQHKSTNQGYHLYFKNDTHWNDLGAYKVFQDVRKSLALRHPNIVLEPAYREFRPVKKYSGDLAQYIGLGDALSVKEPTTDIPVCAMAQSITEPTWGVDLSMCNTNRTKILMVGDSFLFNFYPYFSEAAGQVYMVDQRISRARLLTLIDETKPDLVIEEIVERNLAKPIPH